MDLRPKTTWLLDMEEVNLVEAAEVSHFLRLSMQTLKRTEIPERFCLYLRVLCSLSLTRSSLILRST